MTEDGQHLNLPRSKSQNIVHLLIDRENAIDRRYYLHSRSSKAFCTDFFKCIPPNLTISNIDKPPNYIRKFSPDGKYLICFSKDQQSFENYNFLGIANSSALLYKWRDEYVPPDSNKGLGKHIRQNVFNRLFQLNWSIHLTTFLRPLYREFSIFTEDGIFVIVASYMPIQEENLPSYYTLNPINNTQFKHDLNWYRFYMVKLSDGTVHDTLEYTYDFINLSHNHGVCIYENKMAVVSLFRQLIYIVHLSEGTFINLFTIGQFYHGTDECLCRCVPEYQNECILLGKRFGGLKQKLLVSLYKNTLKCPAQDQRRTLLRQFYRRFKVYKSLEIHKIQFIDGHNLLIRFDNTKQQNLPLDNLEAIKLYVVYNIAKNEMVSIYSEKSKTLLRILRDFYDDFRNIRSIFTGRAPSSTSNNIFLRIAQTRLIEAFPYGESEAAYRLLPQVPISVQSCSVSPYMDLQLFQYDDRLISALERPRLPTYEPIPFKDRETHVTLFRIYPGLHEPFVNENQQSRCCSSKRLISFIFHPLEPFIISVQKFSNRYVTNFHIRNEGTYVPI